MGRKISVVIPFFQRQAGLLRKAVVSALKQKGDYRLEMVIVDDESPIPVRSELMIYCHNYPDTIQNCGQKNAGCFGAHNTALKHVSPDADFVAFLDSDDEW